MAVNCELIAHAVGTREVVMIPRSDTEAITATSLAELARTADADGIAWSKATDDLNVNLVVLSAGHAIAEHINSEVDVLLVGVLGNGRITVDGQPTELAANQPLVIPKGTARSITPLGDRFAYVTCHQRRPGLWPTTRA